MALPGPCPDDVGNEATRLLRMGPASRRGMPPAECREAAVTLQQFAFYLQRELNRARREEGRAEENVRRLASAGATRRPAGSREERMALELAANEAARGQDTLRVEAMLEARGLEMLSYRAGEMAKALMAMARRGDEVA